MIYRVRHVTAYRYDQPVDLAAHLLHLKPRALAGQQVLRASLRCLPAPDHVTESHDHFGNVATRLFLTRPHTSFEVTSEALVGVAFAPPPPAAATPPWEEVARLAGLGGPYCEAAEYAFPSPHAPADPAARDYVQPSFPPGRPILLALLDLLARMAGDFSFQAGITGISTPVAEVLRLRRGVCQDFTHLMLAGMRALGLPGRYVSGYIRTRPPPGQPRRRGADQSHAWVSAWLGPEHGWVGLDPTNNLIVGEEHVIIAWGRDFSDVSPLRGVILGGGHHRLQVSVDLEPQEGP
ncbi:MAG: transglutaminase family protein [Rhodovarius sp.]|nr:transglutaminase family protein [Rhodovarius sp.]MCX7931909.1 transglutaminase family protein [Rhodovarius sp.]MDW8314913.1 transglutaminase family protein [Rhodovarius sp.]